MSKIKVFTTPWHCMHHYDLFNALKDDADFFLVHNTSRQWHFDYRPLPANASFVPFYEPGKYDLAILDIDQQCVNEKMGKSMLFCEMRDLTKDIPRVVINHGCPVYPEFLKIGDDMSFEQAEEKCREVIRRMTDGIEMVVNSYRATSPAEWGWGTPIVHGMNPDDWFDLGKEPRIFTALSPGGCDLYYNRECANEVARILFEKYGHTLWWAKINVETGKSFNFYREFLGGSLIYFDPSFRTPMNRARTEAMFSGCCVVQVEGAHDLERFARPDESMIMIPNRPDQIAELLAELLENQYDRCVVIGQEGKKTAIEKFSYKRYRDDWINLLNKKL